MRLDFFDLGLGLAAAPVPGGCESTCQLPRSFCFEHGTRERVEEGRDLPSFSRIVSPPHGCAQRRRDRAGVDNTSAMSPQSSMRQATMRACRRIHHPLRRSLRMT